MNIEPVQVKSKYDLHAPDGSEMYLLATGSKGGLCQCVLPVGGVSKAIPATPTRSLKRLALKRGHSVLVAACLGCTSPVAVSEPQWFLMARHGECMEVEGLKRKVPDLADIKDPYSFVKLMRQKGHTVTSSEMTEIKGQAVEVKVPEKDLFLIFVTSELCKEL